MGARLARRLDRPFVDSDAALIDDQGRSAAEIAGRDGPATLHREEVAGLFAALTSAEASVVAAAASVVDDPAVRARLGRDDVTTVWLRAAPATLRRRASTGNHRPFVGDDPAAVERLDRERRARYESVADVVVDVDRRTPEQLAAEIDAALSA